jgi:hypothetical protein
MARPQPRRRPGRRDEDQDDDRGRRGRGGPPPKKAPPAILILGGGVLVVVAAIVGVSLATSKKPVVEPIKLAPPPPPPKKEPPPPPAPPPRPQPKPLTVEEKEEIEAAFREAQPHIDQFRKHVKAGWERKKAEDNEGANECWIDAKKEFQKATQIVNALLEDEDRFPLERPGVDRFSERLGAWQREMADLPKVNMTR